MSNTTYRYQYFLVGHYWVVFWPTFSSRAKFADMVLCKIFMHCSIQYFASVSNNMFRASQ